MKTSELIVCSPEILSGTPVSIKNLTDYLEAGDTLDVFLEDFPSVSREQTIAFLEQAKEALLAQVA